MYNELMLKEYKFGTFDCITLVIEVAKLHNIEIPNVNYSYRNLRDYQSFFVEAEKNNRWKKVNRQAHTVVAFEKNGVVTHVGFTISKNRFIHINSETKYAKIENLNDPIWANRIKGYYLYE